MKEISVRIYRRQYIFLERMVIKVQTENLCKKLPYVHESNREQTLYHIGFDSFYIWNVKMSYVAWFWLVFICVILYFPTYMFRVQCILCPGTVNWGKWFDQDSNLDVQGINSPADWMPAHLMCTCINTCDFRLTIVNAATTVTFKSESLCL